MKNNLKNICKSDNNDIILLQRIIPSYHVANTGTNLQGERKGASPSVTHKQRLGMVRNDSPLVSFKSITMRTNDEQCSNRLHESLLRESKRNLSRVKKLYFETKGIASRNAILMSYFELICDRINLLTPLTSYSLNTIN